MKLEIINNQQKLPFGEEGVELIKIAAQAVFEDTSFSEDTEISVTIVDDEQIKEINREYRNIDKSTDVLSFPMYSYSEPMVPQEIIDGECVLGDIVISLETRQAAEYGHSAERELSFLTVHSMLHLLGYDHIQEHERTMMREREEYYLEKIGQRR